MNELNKFETDDSVFVIKRKSKRAGMPENSRYVFPRKVPEIPERLLKYEKAEQLANDLNPEKGMRAFCLLSGNFIAGDFIEAFIVKHNIHVKRLTISTLSMSQNNVDSLKNLLEGDYVDELNLVVSDYFFAHEKYGLTPYIYETLDIDNRLQLAVAATHCKVVLIETHDGLKIVMHGSANLRSSSSLESMMVEESEDLYDFNMEYHQEILNHFSTIKKSLRDKSLWQAVKKQKQ